MSKNKATTSILASFLMLSYVCINDEQYYHKTSSNLEKNVPLNVQEYVNENLSEWSFIDTSQLINNWNQSIPSVDNPTKLSYDFTDNGLEDFAAIMQKKDDEKIFIFNNYDTNSLIVFELDYYIARYGKKIGTSIYLPSDRSNTTTGFLINKFESSIALCYWNGKGYELKFQED